MRGVMKLGLMASIAGSLLACATTKQKAKASKGATSSTWAREGRGDGGGGRSGGSRSRRGDKSRGGRGVAAGVYRLSLDMHRDDGCGVTFVGVHSRGRLTLEVRRSGLSRLTLALKAQERSGPRVRPRVRLHRRARGRKGAARYSRRGWKRKYQWVGEAVFSGKSVTLKLKPVGKGCQHKVLSGVKSGGCYLAVPKMEGECRFACLADTPVQIRRREPGADVPRCGHLVCRFAIPVGQKRKRVDRDLKFFSDRLLLTRDGRPEMVLRRLFDGSIIEGELLKPKSKSKSKPRSKLKLKSKPR